MSGKVLIIDSVATNRIVLKVKLSAAFYTVIQASTLKDASARIQKEEPDVILTGGDLPDASMLGALRQIKALPLRRKPPVIVLLDQDDAATRLALLQAGAADVITKPFCEPVLLARLRSLVRDDQGDAVLGLRADTAQALGFAEKPVQFTARGHIAIMNPNTPHMQALSRTLVRRSAHHVEVFKIDHSGGVADLSTSPDALLIAISGAPGDPGLGHLAELRTAPATRQARIVAMLDSPDSPLAATVLDMGAHDVVGTHTDLAEIEVRLAAQLRQKQDQDALRSRVQSGLEAAVTDPLTGLYNRRYALSQLDKMVTDTAHSQDGFAVMVADLDHFKQVNDTHGHTAGDIVLSRVATQLRGALRPQDTVARIGGEEFLILLPGAGRRTARDLAERLCRIVRETAIIVPGAAHPIHVTISLGATVADPCGRAAPLEAQTLLSQADAALYGSKSEGRDTVTFTRLSAA